MIVLASGNGGHLLLMGLVAQLPRELYVQPLPTEPSLRSDFPPVTVQATGSEAAKLTKHRASEQHLLPWVQNTNKRPCRNFFLFPLFTPHFPG